MIPFLEQSHLDPDLKRKIEKNLEILQTKQLMKQLPNLPAQIKPLKKRISMTIEERKKYRKECNRQKRIRQAAYRKAYMAKYRQTPHYKAYQAEYRRKQREEGKGK